jgi:hypothetical protein
VSIVSFKVSYIQEKNKFKINKSAHVSSSSNVGDCVVNLGENYLETSKVEVTIQGSTSKDNISSISSM